VNYKRDRHLQLESRIFNTKEGDCQEEEEEDELHAASLLGGFKFGLRAWEQPVEHPSAIRSPRGGRLSVEQYNCETFLHTSFLQAPK
jgi:hypothetical protein